MCSLKYIDGEKLIKTIHCESPGIYHMYLSRSQDTDEPSWQMGIMIVGK